MSLEVDWDDWKVVYELALCGTASKTARRLGMNVTTVIRRIDRIERRLGVTLFERGRDGARATLQTEAILNDLASLHSTTDRIETQIMELDAVPSGEVKLSLNMHVFNNLLANVPLSLHAAYPKIKLILDVTDRVVDLKKREADVVIRGSNDPDPSLYGRRIRRLDYAVYGNRTWADRLMPDGAKIESSDIHKDVLWIGYDDSVDVTAPAQWMRKSVSEDRIVVSSTETAVMAEIASTGLALAVLPRLVADCRPKLIDITASIPGLYTELWLLTLRELRNTARVAALIDLIFDELA